jgi:dTDP-D-glucose 4,6-dehydratase
MLSWRLPPMTLQLDYCSSLLNLRDIEGRPNYVFVRGDIQSADLVNRA